MWCSTDDLTTNHTRCNQTKMWEMWDERADLAMTPSASQDWYTWLRQAEPTRLLIKPQGGGGGVRLGPPKEGRGYPRGPLSSTGFDTGGKTTTTTITTTSTTTIAHAAIPPHPNLPSFRAPKRGGGVWPGRTQVRSGVPHLGILTKIGVKNFGKDTQGRPVRTQKMGDLR